MTRCKKGLNGECGYCKGCTHSVKCRNGVGRLMKFPSADTWGEIITRCDLCMGKCFPY